MGLEVINLKRSYGSFSLSLDFSVEDGETLALVGPSGSGKTTALNLISGLTEAESGKVIIDGEDIGELPSWKRNISLVFQDLALFPHLDAGGNIAYGLSIRKVRRNERKKIIEETLETVRLRGFASRRIHTLSGGEKQRVAIARALASKPKALLLDEPFSSLDGPLRMEMRREFLEIRSRSRAPCVFVSHDREEAAILGDRVALMNSGRIVESGAADELFLSPKTEFAARFFSSGQIFSCTILDKRPGCVDIFSPLGALTMTHSEYNDSNPLVLVPPDALSLNEQHDPGWKSFSAIAASSIFDGSKLRVNLLIAQAEKKQISLEVIASARTKPPEPGNTVKVWIDQSLLRFVR